MFWTEETRRPNASASERGSRIGGGRTWTVRGRPNEPGQRERSERGGDVVGARCSGRRRLAGPTRAPASEGRESGEEEHRPCAGDRTSRVSASAASEAVTSSALDVLDGGGREARRERQRARVGDRGWKKNERAP